MNQWLKLNQTWLRITSVELTHGRFPRPGLHRFMGNIPPENMHTFQGTPNFEYLTKEPVKCLDSSFFRILQAIKAKMQDSKRFFVRIFHLSSS